MLYTLVLTVGVLFILSWLPGLKASSKAWLAAAVTKQLGYQRTPGLASCRAVLT